MTPNEIKALENVQRYRHRNGDGAMVPKGDGPWLLRDDVLAALESQPVVGQVSDVDSPLRCNPDVYEKGELVGIFAWTAEEAETYRKRASSSEWLYDWFFGAGRVVMKRLSLRTAQQPDAPAVEAVSKDELRAVFIKRGYSRTSFQDELVDDIHALLTSRQGGL